MSGLMDGLFGGGGRAARISSESMVSEISIAADPYFDDDEAVLLAERSKLTVHDRLQAVRQRHATRAAALRSYDLKRQSAGSSRLLTDPKQCVLSGDGLETATTRQLSTFTIQAIDSEGKPQRHGSDAFAVNVRGKCSGVVLRARIIHTGKGLFSVEYKPTVRSNAIATRVAWAQQSSSSHAQQQPCAARE